ncbi:MAG: CRISPR-associated endonuclease Cas1 [Coriobacteriia bacterium]|nr:CRISPR-associated endonuclease Cas1 [Coriobacteriia bacterium]
MKSVSDGSERKLPFMDVSGISVFGKPQLSTQLIRECLSENIPISFYSDDGHFFGHISSSERIDPLRQKKQIYLTDNQEFCLCWSRAIISAKIQNSIALLSSFSDVCEFDSSDIRHLNHSMASLELADSVEMLLGFEGNAAKNYFECLPKLLQNEDFIFSGRSARPPKDPFNSMLSYGYSIFYRNIIGAIERHGLHPYFAYMHKLKFGHASLASDLIEEYRAPLIDKTVVELVNSGEIEVSDFYKNDAGAIYMTKNALKMLTDRFSEIIAKNQQYFVNGGDKKSYGFQVMLDKKITSLIHAIEKRDASIYRPLVWKLVRQ